MRICSSLWMINTHMPWKHGRPKAAGMLDRSWSPHKNAVPFLRTREGGNSNANGCPNCGRTDKFALAYGGKYQQDEIR